MNDFKRAMKERDRRRRNRRDLIEMAGFIAFCCVVFWLVTTLLGA